jgi:hypothetical protein
MDSNLKGRAEARVFLDGDLARKLAERGIDVEVA